MSPEEKLKKLEKILREQTGKSFDDFGSIEEAINSLSFRLNNEQIIVNRLNKLSEDQHRIIQMWRQSSPISVIASTNGFSLGLVEQTIKEFVDQLHNDHFEKFLKGWTLDHTGEPISPDKPIITEASLAEARFQEWLLILGLKHA